MGGLYKKGDGFTWSSSGIVILYAWILLHWRALYLISLIDFVDCYLVGYGSLVLLLAENDWTKFAAGITGISKVL